MPLLQIVTNTTIENPDTLAGKASAFTAGLLGKPESYVMVRILPEQTLLFAGSNEPAAHVKLKSLGLPEDRCAGFSEKICSFIEAETGISPSRTYIEFSSPPRQLWGWDGRTF